MALALRITLAVAIIGASSAAFAQPAQPEDVLREGNAAATAGDWSRVSSLVDPLLQGQLPPADLAEAYRLAGLAAYFQGRKDAAAGHFLSYLRIDLDARLDPALHPPDLVNFFEDVKQKNAAELRKRRPKPRWHWVLNLLPPAGQFQNGDRTKGYVIAGALGAFAIGNVTSYLMLRSWCTRVSGDSGTSATCDDNKDRASTSTNLRVVNIATGVGLILTYAYGVYDGVSRYRRREIQPFVVPTSGGSVVGIGGTF